MWIGQRDKLAAMEKTMSVRGSVKGSQAIGGIHWSPQKALGYSKNMFQFEKQR